MFIFALVEMIYQSQIQLPVVGNVLQYIDNYDRV